MRLAAAFVTLVVFAACTTKTTETAQRAPRCSVDGDCDDGVYCNGPETCDVAADRCVRGAAPACDDAVDCTVDLCDEARQACVHVPDGSVCGIDQACFATGCGPAIECAVPADCDDGFFCNGTETCVAGRCQHGTAPVCDDGVACTADFCDELMQRCAHVGDAWACAAGERCSPTLGCVATAECAADADCDDHVFCNGPETCNLGTGKCEAGTRPACDDAVACTVDLCDELLGRCVSMADATRCASGELCSPATGCYVPARCGSDPECDDGVFCNGVETCNLGTGRCQAGTPPACADTAACTVDLCDELVHACVHLDEPPAAGCAQLAVIRSGTGTGTIGSTPSAIDCGALCAAWFEPSTIVTLAAAAGPSSSFSGWSGACTGTGACVVSMSAARNVTGAFTQVTYPLGVSRTGGGSVVSSPSGIYCGAACAASFAAGTTVALTAQADLGGTFAGWSGDCSGMVCTVAMSSARSVSARFTFPVSVAKAGTGGGTVTSAPAGISCGSTCSAALDGGTLVTLTATPDSTSQFTGWSGACSGTGTCTLTMDAAKAATATFQRVTYDVTVARAGAGGGAVTSSPAGIDCGATCSATYTVNASVTLTAVADATSTFTGWSGACSGSAPTCNLTLDAAKSVTATFARRSYALTVNRTGAGTVTSAPGDIFCGAACAAVFDAGTTVTLTATPDATTTFTGWSGGGCSGTGTCPVTMNGAMVVTATFVTNTFQLTVTRAGAGSGNVTSSDGGISCGAGCAASYTASSIVTLTATPTALSAFAGWSGACTGTGACTVTMSQARNVTATFTNLDFDLTVTRAGTGGGTVTSVPAGISCGATCAATYTGGASVSLAAVADSSSVFASWSGACTGTGACNVTMDQARSVTATFTRKSYALTVTRTGGGTVASSPAGIYCGLSCAATYDAGSTVVLTATPDAGGTFPGWGGACSGTSPTCTVTIDAAKAVTATFTYPLTVGKTGDGTGSVVSFPAGVSCGVGCSTASSTYNPGTVVSLTAAPSADSSFAGWAGACSGTGACVVTMDGAKAVQAMFPKQRFELLVEKDGAGGGTVTSTPAGISCGGSCLASFDGGTTVTLTATPDASSDFTGWSGACVGTGTCDVTLDATKSVQATFAPH